MSTPPLSLMAGIIAEYLDDQLSVTPGQEFRASDVAQALEGWEVSLEEVERCFGEIQRRLPGQASLGPADRWGGTTLRLPGVQPGFSEAFGCLPCAGSGRPPFYALHLREEP